MGIVRVDYQPKFFIGLLLFVIGIFGPTAFGINDQLTKFCGIIVGIIGLSLANKGKKIIKD